MDDIYLRPHPVYWLDDDDKRLPAPPPSRPPLQASTFLLKWKSLCCDVSALGTLVLISDGGSSGDATTMERNEVEGWLALMDGVA